MPRCLHAFLALASLSVLPAGEAPFGADDWKASPTDPVGFAGQGGHWYPGATPPSEFWEGTPVETEVKNAEGKVRKEWGYADQKAKNILWKVAVPGWSDSLPVVVGKRVISLTSPHYVTCYDADTGKVLWQDALKFMTLPVLAKDRKSIGPVPDPAKAVAQQQLFELTLGWWRARLGATATYRDNRAPVDLTPRKEFIQSLIPDLERWKNELKGAYPDIGPVLDGEIAFLQRCLKPGEDLSVVPAGMKSHRHAVYAGKVPATVSAGPDLIFYAGEKLGVPADDTFCNGWQGNHSDTMATPVSDGEIVGVTFGHGQIAAYEVVTGKRLWAWRDPQLFASSAGHCQSPLLWKDLLLVPGGGMSAKRGKSDPDSYTMTIIGIDKRTGAIRWENTRGPGGTPQGGKGIHGDHMSPCLARIPDGKGGIRGLVVGNQGAVLDAETGAKLGQFPHCVGATAENPAKNDYWGSGFVTCLDQRIYKCWGGDCSAPPVNVWPISLDADGKLVIGAGFKSKDRGASHSPFALSPKVLVVNGTLMNPATGETLASLGRSTLGESPVLAGNRLIFKKDYGTRLAMFSVVDVADPAKPAVLNKTPNLIGDGSMPVDIADTYFPSLTKPEFKRWCLGCYMGIRNGFGVYTGGVTCQGGRIYLKSQTHLYAIGEK